MRETAPAAEPSPFSTPEERSRGRALKREAVLRAAVRIFNARGFHAASLDDVAASLKISKPTIYYHLGNKEEVLLECVMRGIGMLQSAAEAATQGPGSGLGRLQAFLCRYAEIVMDDFGRCAVRTGEEALSEQGAMRFRALKGEVDASFRSLIAQGVADGSLAPVDVRIAAFTLAGALSWTARWHDPNGPMSSRQIASAMVALLTSGIAPRS